MTAMQQTFRLNDDTAIPAVGFGTYLVSNDDAPEAVSSAISNGYQAPARRTSLWDLAWLRVKEG